MAFPELKNLYGFAEIEDSQYFEETSTDPTIRVETEGGYVITRKRFTRAPRKLITTGFTFISDAAKEMLASYYAMKGGGAEAIPYIHPISGVTLTMRFKEPMKFKYVGIGPRRAWDVKSISLEQL